MFQWWEVHFFTNHLIRSNLNQVTVFWPPSMEDFNLNPKAAQREDVAVRLKKYILKNLLKHACGTDCTNNHWTKTLYCATEQGTEIWQHSVRAMRVDEDTLSLPSRLLRTLHCYIGIQSMQVELITELLYWIVPNKVASECICGPTLEETIQCM